jgi:hypothetical protein
MAEDVLGGRDSCDFGQMVYQRAAELRSSCPFLHEARKFRVVTPNFFVPNRLRRDPQSKTADEDEERRERAKRGSPERHDRTPYLRDT